METKECRICRAAKPLNEFAKSKRHADGLLSACKRCIEAQRLALVGPAIDESGGYVKRCSECRIMRPITEFVRSRYGKGGRHHACKHCTYPKREAYEKTAKDKINVARRLRYWRDPEKARDTQIRWSRKVGKGVYQRLLERQGNGCAICGRTDNPGKSRLAIDHCHKSGKIRGLLCTCCNQAIGQMKDSPELLRKAAAYLETTRVVDS